MENQTILSHEARKQYMESSDRRARIMALNAIPGPRNIPRPLLPTVDRTDYDIFCADRDLTKRGLKDEDPFVRVAALQAMKMVYDNDAEGAMLVSKVLNTDTDYLVRATAINTMIYPTAIPDDIIQVGMEDDDTWVVAATLRAVRRFNKKANLPKRDIVRALMSEGDILFKEALDYCRGGVPHVTFDMGETLMEWAYHDDRQLRAAAMAQMDHPNWREYAEEIWGGLEDPSLTVRQQALITVAHAVNFDCKAEEQLAEALKNPDLRPGLMDLLLHELPEDKFELWEDAIKDLAGIHNPDKDRIAAIKLLTKMGAAPVRDVGRTTGCAEVFFGPENLIETVDTPPSALVRVRVPDDASILKLRDVSFGSGYYVTKAVVTDAETVDDGDGLVRPGTILTGLDRPLYVSAN